MPFKSRGCNEKQGFRGNCDSQGKLGMCPSLAEPDSGGIPRSEVFDYKPQANKKFFDPTIFQKCWRGVGEQPTFAEQITELHNETKQKSRRKSEESQLPSKSRGCNEIQDFRSNCDFQASWGCAPALPNRIRAVFLEAMFCMKQCKNGS